MWCTGDGLRSKLVDFAVTLKEDTTLKAAYPNLEPIDGAPSRSFISTCLNTVIREPIAFSIVTKTQNGRSDRALVQLYTWACAQLQRVVRLAHGAGQAGQSLPALPLMSVHGSVWRLYAVSWAEDAGYVRTISRSTQAQSLLSLGPLGALRVWADRRYLGVL